MAKVPISDQLADAATMNRTKGGLLVDE